MSDDDKDDEVLSLSLPAIANFDVNTFSTLNLEFPPVCFGCFFNFPTGSTSNPTRPSVPQCSGKIRGVVDLTWPVRR